MRNSEAESEPVAGSAPSLAEAWERFRGTLLDRLGVLERVGANLLEEVADEGSVREAARSARQLSASLRTFGLTRGTELAAEIETLLEAGVPDSGHTFRYTGLVVALRDAIEEGRPPQARDRDATGAKQETGEHAGAILVVEPDDERAETLAAEAMVRGWPPDRTATLAEGCERAASLNRIVAAVVDPDSGAEAELERLVGLLLRHGQTVPVIFHSTTRSQEDRLRGVSLGAGGFVQKGTPPALLFDRVEALLEADLSERPTVLVVDQLQEDLDLVSSTLGGRGIHVKTLRDPGQFWRTLEAVRPDMVLIDADMTEISGHDLCRSVRADPRWQLLPVLFMTARSGPAAAIAGFESGADDYITKPLHALDLAVRVDARLKAVAQRRMEGAGTSGGGVSVLQVLGIQLALASRYREIMSVAIVSLPAVKEEEGAGANAVEAAAMLRQVMEPEDLVARLGRGEVLVSRHRETEDDVRRWLHRVLKVPPGVHLPVGTAGYPDRNTPEALLESARADLERSWGAAAWRKGRPQHAEADIVIVEDDEAVGGLLSKTLDARGYTTHWIRDGAEASELLTGEAPPLRASVILLDVGLPGIDGFTLLRQLRRDRITPRTRVVMVTGRASQSEVMRSLELGAFDHIGKPFSMSEFLHRVRRAMGRDAVS